MLINLKVKTLDAQTHEFSIDNEITVREFKDNIAERTNISADQQRIIYCGRVLADDKQLKEYDVDGKVVHVAERPPPSQRGPSTSSSFLNDQGGNVRERTPRGMRNSPLFRALDGMVVGTMAIPVNAANMNNSQMPVNPFTSSSSFCMNRITVARHMLDCANNIANYLEDPERGLNNTSLDILARGRWTMESTVVEVGITAADLPQNQNIVEMVQGAVSAALRRNGNTNVTVVQLPTVFGSNEEGASGAGGSSAEAIDGAQSQSATDTMESTASTSDGGGGVGVGGAPTATVIIEDYDDEDDDDDDDLLATAVGVGVSPEEEEEEDGATNASSSAAQAGSAASTSSASMAATAPSAPSAAAVGASADGANNSSTSTGTNTDDNPSRRRTGTSVLGEVVEQMRTVQTRLNPFIQQFYDMLLNESSFEESDIAGRETAQRLFDRVSEAFHYMSHAQHAISDLMLDVSQPAPRYLTCRPILVEQSGYVSSNNYLSSAAAAAAAAAAAGIRQLPQQAMPARSENMSTDSNAATPPAAAAAAAATPTSSADAAFNDSTASTTSPGAAAAVVEPAIPTVAETTTTPPPPRSANTDADDAGAVEDPVDDPIVAPVIPGAAAVAAANVGTQSNDNHQMQMARLIQAVVNAAPSETEFHVQINAPSIVSFGVPINPTAATARGVNALRQLQRDRASAPETPMSSDAPSSEENNGSNNNQENGNGGENSSNGGSAETTPTYNNQSRAHTATLPTTSTQTRSTSRPQLQIGNLPHAGWNGRFIPANVMTSFDRFLPCNSHHIREPENAGSSNANGTPTSTGATAAANNQNRDNAANERTIRNIADMLQRPGGSARPPLIVGSTMSTPPSRANGNAAAATAASPSPNLFSLRNLLSNMTASPPATSRRTGSGAGAGAAAGATPRLSTNAEIFASNLRNQLLNFLHVQVFSGRGMTAQNTQTAINRAIRWFGDSLLYLPQYEKPEYDARNSVCNLLRQTLPLLITLISSLQETAVGFETRIRRIFEKLKSQLFSVLCVCAGRVNAEMYWGQLMRLLLVPVRLNFRDEALQFLTSYVNSEFPLLLDMADAQQFIVHRSSATARNPQPMDVEEAEEAVAASTSDSNQVASSDDDDDDKEAVDEINTTNTPEAPLPSVVAGSEPWHHNFPNDWLPIITRDIQNQEESQTQAPFSDAYISGMSAKRRKLLQNSKPPTDVRTLIAENVRRAIQTVGVTTSTASNQQQTPEEITNAIASDNTVQTSYREAVRTNLRERLKNDPNYKAEKYPHTSSFLNNK